MWFFSPSWVEPRRFRVPDRGPLRPAQTPGPHTQSGFAPPPDGSSRGAATAPPPRAGTESKVHPRSPFSSPAPGRAVARVETLRGTDLPRPCGPGHPRPPSSSATVRPPPAVWAWPTRTARRGVPRLAPGRGGALEEPEGPTPRGSRPTGPPPLAPVPTPPTGRGPICPRRRVRSARGGERTGKGRPPPRGALGGRTGRRPPRAWSRPSPPARLRCDSGSGSADADRTVITGPAALIRLGRPRATPSTRIAVLSGRGRDLGRRTLSRSP